MVRIAHELRHFERRSWRKTVLPNNTDLPASVRATPPTQASGCCLLGMSSYLRD